MSDTSYSTRKIERPCSYCNGTGIQVFEVDENYRTRDGFKLNKEGWFESFAMGVCKECGEYIPPTWMIYYGDPCPLCKKPFHSSQPIVKEEEL